MGRIRTKDIKDLAFDLHEAYEGKFSGDFEANKTAVNETKLLEGKSKRFRNRVAGYLVRVTITKARKAKEEAPIVKKEAKRRAKKAETKTETAETDSATPSQPSENVAEAEQKVEEENAGETA